MSKIICKILFVGEGGQGVQFAAQLLTRAAFEAGKKVLYLPNFGVEQRGGVSVAFVQISDKEEIPYPKFEKADFVVLFCGVRCLTRAQNYIDNKTIVINSDAKKTGYSANLFLLGKLIYRSQILPPEKIIAELEKIPRHKENNIQAFQEGLASRKN